MQTLETRHSNRRIRGLTARGAAGERQERDVARALDGHGYRALMSCAGSKLASRLNLAALANVAAKPTEILVIDVADIVCAILANLAARAESATSAATATRSARTAGRATAAVSTALCSAEAAWAGITRFSLLC